MSRISKIIGPPGTGKTSYVLDLITKACQKYDPGAIGAVSYTNSAVNEIKDRIAYAAGVDAEAATNVKTMHSHCFHLLELKKDKVADTKIKQWNKDYPQWELPINAKLSDDEEDTGPKITTHTVSENRTFFSTMQVLRNNMVPVKQWPTIIQDFWDDWKWWMDMNGYIDFTGMLEDVLENELYPPIDVLFVDEAQDASKLQLEVLKMWSQQTVSTLYVGDSDQAIFRWNGASPEGFINLNSTWNKVLEQSYRVPKKVHEYAMKIIAQAESREEIVYLPTDVEGRLFKPEAIPDLGLPGTHMLIARCQFQLNRWREFLKQNNTPWHNPYRPEDTNWNPLNTKTWRAAQTYLKMKNGEEVSRSSFRELIKMMVVKGNLLRGVKTSINDLRLPKRISAFDLGELRVFAENFLLFEKPVTEIVKAHGVAGEFLQKMDEYDIMQDPKVILGTIHSVKGGEADHVWMDMGTSTRIRSACLNNQRNYDDEVRVAYVGVTRAKETFGLLRTKGQQNEVLL
jgi:DNA helicase-2/ATP-dependent DNA helicase PcrA